MGKSALFASCVLALACAGEAPIEADVPASSEGSAPIDGSTGSSTSGDGSSSSEDEGSTGDDADASADTGTPKHVLVEAGPTKDAEQVATLPIARSEQQAERMIVLELGADRLPELRAGDRLLVAAEAQVTTRCDVGQVAPGCDYDPKIRAQLMLSGTALSQPQTQTCTRSEHHCMFVFRPDDAERLLDDAMPCVADGDCRVSLVMWAWDPQARSGGQDRVLVGENEGDYLDNGVVQPDKARIMAIRERNLVASDRDVDETTPGGTVHVPSDATATLVYSHRLGDTLAKDEQYLVEAKLVTAVGGRARVSSKLFVSRDPDATDGDGLDAISPQEIGEHNGINCTAGQSPCTTRKVAVFRVTDDVEGPVYVQLVVHGAVPGGGSTAITVQRDQGFVRSTRFDPAQRG